MTTNQEARQIAIRGSTSTTYPLNADWHALWDDAGIAAGPWNARMLAWINEQLGTSYTNLPGAMHAYAANGGFSRWSDGNTVSGEAGFNPASLTGIIGVYDVSDLSSMTVGRDGSGGAPSVGDPVGTLADQAASGNDLAAPSDAARPVLRQTGGGLYYLEHDGVDDKLVSGTIATATAPIYIAIGAQKSGDIGRSFVGVVQDGSNQLAYLNNSAGRGQGLLRTTTLGVKLTVSTVGVFPLDTPAILESIGDGTNHIARVNGADEKTVAASPFTGLTSVYITTTDNALQHDLFGFVVRAGTANSGTDAADIRTWLADRNGATLA